MGKINKLLYLSLKLRNVLKPCFEYINMYLNIEFGVLKFK